MDRYRGIPFTEMTDEDLERARIEMEKYAAGFLLGRNQEEGQRMLAGFNDAYIREMNRRKPLRSTVND